MIDYTNEQIKKSPYLLCQHAAQISKGKLPNDFHSAMLLHSVTDSRNFFVKLYFQHIMTGEPSNVLQEFATSYNGQRPQKRIYGELEYVSERG